LYASVLLVITLSSLKLHTKNKCSFFNCALPSELLCKRTAEVFAQIER